MNDALTCPACEAQLRTRDELLAHIWLHLRLGEAKSFNGSKIIPTQTRVCWCGKEYYAFIYWMEHMAGKDVQAHYAAALLGISR